MPIRVRVVRFAVRRSLRNRYLFLEDDVLLRTQFLDLAERCGLYVRPRLLNWYVEHGYLAPVTNTRDGPGFSRYQLYWLSQLEEYRALSLRVEPYCQVEQQDGRSWLKNLQLNAAPPTADARFNAWLELVVLLQNKYLPASRGHRNWELSHIDDSVNPAEVRYMRREYLPRVAGDKPLRELGLTLEAAQSLRRDMALRFQRLDPLADWYPLTRLASQHGRDKLKGTARLAQELYVGDRVLENYFWDLTGKPQQDAEDVRFGPGADRRLPFHGRTKDYRDPVMLDLVLSELGLHPARAAVIFVEGKTETLMYPEVAMLFGYDVPFLGIEFHDLTGVDNARSRAELLKFLAKPLESGPIRLGDGAERIVLARRPTFTYLWIDHENSARKQSVLREFQRARPPEFLKLWKPDLERANFTASEIAAGLTSLVGRTIAAHAVQQWHAGTGSLEKWVWDRYEVRMSKPDLVPHYLKVLRRDLRRAQARKEEPTRPILQLVLRMIRVVAGTAPFEDPELTGKVLLGR